jgi:hypothetical protein
MTGVAVQLEELRDTVGEIDALAALALESFDRADWGCADRQLAERVAYVLVMIARSAATAVSKLDSFHVAIADVQPVPAGERWDGECTASGPGDETAMSAGDAEIVRRMRARLAERFGQPVDHPFFEASYQPGEDPDAALLRIFKRNKWVLNRSDEDVIAAMAHCG